MGTKNSGVRWNALWKVVRIRQRNGYHVWIISFGFSVPTTIEMFKSLNAFMRINTNKSALVVNMQTALAIMPTNAFIVKITSMSCLVWFGWKWNWFSGQPAQSADFAEKCFGRAASAYGGCDWQEHKRFVAAKWKVLRLRLRFLIQPESSATLCKNRKSDKSTRPRQQYTLRI